jgi:hypothetical protein
MRTLIPTILFLFILMSCGSETEPVEEAAAKLEGRWELVAARRDNVKTTLLDGLYFEFAPDGAFRTNLLTNEDQRGRYQREEEEIYTEAVEVPLTYTIQALTEDQLILRSNYQGYLFDFALVRTPVESD